MLWWKRILVYNTHNTKTIFLVITRPSGWRGSLVNEKSCFWIMHILNLEISFFLIMDHGCTIHYMYTFVLFTVALLKCRYQTLDCQIIIHNTHISSLLLQMVWRRLWRKDNQWINCMLGIALHSLFFLWGDRGVLPLCSIKG